MASPAAAPAGSPAAKPAARPRLFEKYRSDVSPALAQQFGVKNPLAIPHLTKIVVSMGVGKSIENRARIDHAARELASITGQKPVITKARHSISGFRLREGMPIGLA